MTLDRRAISPCRTQIKHSPEHVRTLFDHRQHRRTNRTPPIGGVRCSNVRDARRAVQRIAQTQSVHFPTMPSLINLAAARLKAIRVASAKPSEMQPGSPAARQCVSEMQGVAGGIFSFAVGTLPCRAIVSLSTSKARSLALPLAVEKLPRSLAHSSFDKMTTASWKSTRLSGVRARFCKL